MVAARRAARGPRGHKEQVDKPTDDPYAGRAMAKSTHRWRFFRAGGVDQIVLTEAEDLARLGKLDQKLWVALACPVRGTEIDERTLALIDADHDGRVRAPEVLAAVDWCGKVFRGLAELFEGGGTVPLKQLDGSTPEGKAVLSSAKRILADQGKGDAKEIGLEDVQAMEKVFVATRFNGDGIVPADSAEDDATRGAIEDIIKAVGSANDRSAKPGVDAKLLDTFFSEAAALLTWKTEGEDKELRPLGDATGAAAEALAAVEPKVADYFTRCRVAAWDDRGAGALNTTEAELGALASKELDPSCLELAKLPIARVAPAGQLPLGDGLNPAWAERVKKFATDAVTPLLGARSKLSEADFGAVVAALAAHRAWLARKPTGPVAALDLARVAEIVSSGAEQRIRELVAQDAALESEYAQIEAVEKAIRFRRDLAMLLRNFVSFADFYGRKGAVFQAGTLYLDGRACDLTVMVNDAAKHAALASFSRAYLAYCDCTRPNGEKMGIVAAFTAGDVDALMPGRNGIFYDRKGRDWDATITSIVENPISVRQAFWSPYKRLIRMVEEQVAKRAAEKEKASTGRVDAAAASAASVGAPPAPGAPPPAPGAPVPPGAPVAGAPPKKLDIGVVAAIGVAVAGVATFLSSVLATFLGLGMWMPVGIIALLLAISGPSMLIAWLKLRQRNLGPILDANGWAINGRVKINVPFGGSLTQVAQLPKGAVRAVRDPYAEKKRPWWLYFVLLVLVVAALLWVLGKLDAWLPASVSAKRLLYGEQLPASPSAAPAAPAAKAGP